MNTHEISATNKLINQT